MREFILGCIVAPALVCFAWMTILGATAIDLELTGMANGEIIAASSTSKLFVTLGHMLSGGFLTAITVMCVVLIMTFLVTSADSGILVMNTIMSGGEQKTWHQAPHSLGRNFDPCYRHAADCRENKWGFRPDGSASKCDDYWGTTLYHVDGVNVHIAWQGDVAGS